MTINTDDRDQPPAPGTAVGFIVRYLEARRRYRESMHPGDRALMSDVVAVQPVQAEITRPGPVRAVELTEEHLRGVIRQLGAHLVDDSAPRPRPGGRAFADGRTVWGWGERHANGAASFVSPAMTEAEARRHVGDMRRLFPEDADRYELLRWRIGPATVVREDQAQQPETDRQDGDRDRIPRTAGDP